MITRSGRPAAQRDEELLQLLELFRADGVRSYLEIGARFGDTFDQVMRSLPARSRGVAIDWPEGPWGVSGSEGHLVAAIHELGHLGYDVQLIVGKSQASTTLAAATNLGPFDAILIDADHRYEAVRADWERYRPLGRMIAFHDIVGEGQRSGQGDLVEVPRLWAEIKAAESEVRELVAPDSRMGLGVVWPAPRLRGPSTVPKL